MRSCRAWSSRLWIIICCFLQRRISSHAPGFDRSPALRKLSRRQNLLLINAKGQVVDVAVQREGAVERCRKGLRHSAALFVNTHFRCSRRGRARTTEAEPWASIRVPRPTCFVYSTRRGSRRFRAEGLCATCFERGTSRPQLRYHRRIRYSGVVETRASQETEGTEE